MTIEDQTKMEMLGKIFIALELHKKYILVFEEINLTQTSKILSYFKLKTPNK